MLRPEPIRRHELNGITVEYRSQASGPRRESALDSNYVVMHLSNSATLDIRLDEERLSRRIVPGDLHILPEGSRFESHLSDSCEILVISFSNAILSQIEGGLSPDCTLRPFLAVRDLHLQNLLAALQEELTRGCPTGEAYLLDLCWTLMHYLARRYSSAAEKSIHTMPDGLPLNRLRIVLDFIHGNLHNELTLAKLASLVQMSPQHFANLFRKSTGVPPHQYVLRERLESGKRRLLETGRPIADIALEVGFASQSHFTDVFHKMLGTSPSRYRRQFSQWTTSQQRTEEAL